MGANTELAAVETPFGAGETDLDCCWPKILLEVPMLGVGGLAVADGVEALKSEDAGRLISDTGGAEVCAGFWLKMFEGVAEGCSLGLRLPSGEVFMSSASVLRLKRGFWVVEVACPNLKVLVEGAFPNKEPLALFGVDGAKLGLLSFFAATDCPNKDAPGAEAVVAEAVVVWPNRFGAPVVAGLG